MAYRRKHHHHHRRSNPFGVSSGTMKDAAWVAAGALGAAVAPTFLPAQNNGWTGVALTAGGAVAASFVARSVGGQPAGDEALKGGLAIAIVRALHTAGAFKTITLGLYAPSWFAVPTSSDAYGRTPVPAFAAPPPAKGMGAAQRYRGRYN